MVNRDLKGDNELIPWGGCCLYAGVLQHKSYVADKTANEYTTLSRQGKLILLGWMTCMYPRIGLSFLCNGLSDHYHTIFQNHSGPVLNQIVRNTLIYIFSFIINYPNLFTWYLAIILSSGRWVGKEVESNKKDEFKIIISYFMGSSLYKNSLCIYFAADKSSSKCLFLYRSTLYYVFKVEQTSDYMINSSFTPEPLFIQKAPSYEYRNPQYKRKMVRWPSHVYNGSPYTNQTCFLCEKRPYRMLVSDSNR